MSSASIRNMSGGPTGVPRRLCGFTLIELMITIAVVAILASIALPNYREYVRRSAREAMQSQLIELAGIQEKIYLNSNAYTSNVAAAYTGSASGGLGVPGGKSLDGRYTIAATADAASFTLTATPVVGGTQAADGNLTISSDGSRSWGSKSW